MTLKIGGMVPDFSLPGVDGKTYTLHELAQAHKAVAVVISCNHCPYVVAYEDRMVALQRDFTGRGATLVAVNANDAKRYGEDSFDEMKKRAKQKKFNFPYLRDETQETARAYGAVCTPEVFLADSGMVLRYHGNIDDDKTGKNIPRHHLREAFEEVLAGRKVQVPETRPFGCSVKWKE